MKKVVFSEKAPAAIGPYSQAIRTGNTIYVSGQLPVDPATGAFPEGIEAQAKQSLTNIKNILESEGYSRQMLLRQQFCSKTSTILQL